LTPKSKVIQAPSSALLAQRVSLLPSIAIAAARPGFWSPDDSARSGFTTTPGLLVSTTGGTGSAGVTGVPENAWISKIE
jgi:hypothetical protein